ncbi:hypothetical protein RRG08_013594 [Elysia crispata]|uniref:Uncharacterized protein n=1 Tax=Elysia crispata TaxID=231223 RepID=A0AAE0Y2N7_9GAST|nr:hypothetical protein RRG08_013594 [Elysia crispata]
MHKDKRRNMRMFTCRPGMLGHRLFLSRLMFSRFKKVRNSICFYRDYVLSKRGKLDAMNEKIVKVTLSYLFSHLATRQDLAVSAVITPAQLSPTAETIPVDILRIFLEIIGVNATRASHLTGNGSSFSDL